MSYSVAVLVVSDTASAQPSSDRSGPVLSSAFSSHPSGAFTVQHTSIVPDSGERIRQTVQHWIDDLNVRLVVTCGGTGFGLRDGTPEALEPLITRKTPALTHAITAYSLSKTPLAALSRSLTGIRKLPNRTEESLIIALPGSPKAVNECLEVLLSDSGLLLHALQLLSGGSGQQKHHEMQGIAHRQSTALETGTDTGSARTDSHQHHHQHHHHRGGGCAHHGGLHTHKAPVSRTRPEDHASFRTQDPGQGASLRHRSSPYPIISLDEAHRLIRHATPTAKRVLTLPVNSHLVGHVLAQDVVATHDLPPGPTTNVDGYAVHASSTPPGDYRVVTLRTLAQRSLQPGEIFRINTGQGLPAGADSVVMVEDTELIKESDGEEHTVKVLAQVDVGENVRPKASDVKANAVVLRKGTHVTALGGEIGTLAFLGHKKVQVFRKPTVAILSTGNELLDVDQANVSSDRTESWGFTVFDANRPGLRAAIDGLGFSCVDLGIVSDDVSTTLGALERGLAQADILITTGGTSMGESDLLKPLIERNLRGTIHFGRVAMKPGKPTTFASVGERLVFALPGNPASALVCFYIFVLPALRQMSGFNGQSPRVPVRLASSMRLDPRPEFHRAVVRVEQGVLVAHSTGSQRSSGMHSMATANALVCVPPLSAASETKVLEAGSTAEAILLGPLV